MGSDCQQEKDDNENIIPEEVLLKNHTVTHTHRHIDTQTLTSDTILMTNFFVSYEGTTILFFSF